MQESRTDARALEVLSPAKSFALLAPTPQEAAEWTAALRKAVAEVCVCVRVCVCKSVSYVCDAFLILTPSLSSTTPGTHREGPAAQPLDPPPHSPYARARPRPALGAGVRCPHLPSLSPALQRPLGVEQRTETAPLPSLREVRLRGLLGLQHAPAEPPPDAEAAGVRGLLQGALMHYVYVSVDP